MHGLPQVGSFMPINWTDRRGCLRGSRADRRESRAVRSWGIRASYTGTTPFLPGLWSRSRQIATAPAPDQALKNSVLNCRKYYYFWPDGTPADPCMKQLSEEEKNQKH